MIERLFNLREGLTRNDLKKGDMLNHRYFDEPPTRCAGCRRRVIDREKFKKMVDDSTGTRALIQWRSQAETLKRLGLEKNPPSFCNQDRIAHCAPKRSGAQAQKAWRRIYFSGW